MDWPRSHTTKLLVMWGGVISDQPERRGSRPTSPGRTDDRADLFNMRPSAPMDHVGEAQLMTVTATYWRSSPRSNDGQTILERTLATSALRMTCTFGRDGRIRTGGLLLPKQAR
jgi:hypothetical protein